MIIKNLCPFFALLLISVFSLLCPRAFADQSCFIHSTDSGTYTTGSSPLLTLSPDHVSSVTALNASYTYVIQFITDDPIGCKNWYPADNTVHFYNYSGNLQDTKYFTPDGNALIRTSIPGIDYTVQLMCYVSDGCGSSHPTVDLYLKGTNGTDNKVPSQSSGEPYTKADNQWKLKFTLWVTPEFKPQKGINTGYSLPGTIAHFQIGPSSQGLIIFTATTSTLQFTVPPSSCSFGVAQGNTVSGNNIALGDYWINDIKNNNTPVIPFSISLAGCYTPKLKVKMTSAFVSSDQSMLGLSSGSASGVAVRIINTDTSSVMLPNSQTSTDLDRSSDWSSQADIHFSAQLLPDGGAIKAGDFNAAATFLMDYE